MLSIKPANDDDSGGYVVEGTIGAFYVDHCEAYDTREKAEEVLARIKRFDPEPEAIMFAVEGTKLRLRSPTGE